MRARFVALTIVGAAVGAASLVVARHDPDGSLGGGSVAGNLALLGAGLALIVAGAAAWARRPASRFGLLLAGAGIAWFLAELQNPSIGSGVAFTIGLVTYAACGPLVAHAALAYPDGRLRGHVERGALAVAYTAAFGVLGIGCALVFDPGRQGCSECPANHLAVTSEPGLLSTLQRVGVWLGLAWAVALAGLAVWRLLRSSPAARLLTAPVLVGAVACLAIVAADYAHGVGRGYLSNDSVDERLWAWQAVALVAMALGVGLGWVRARRARDAMARLVVELDAGPRPGELRDALARALADSDLELVYPVAGGRHVDGRGHPVDLEPAAGRAATPLLRGGRPVAVLVHRTELLDDPELIEEVGKAARLALDRERLSAELRGQLQALRASRARTVAAGDAERRRLERDLHDGAQQRLVVLSLALRLLCDRVGPGRAERVEAAMAELSAALEDLRELGRGIYPAVLADEGLAAAVEALAEEGTAPVLVGTMPAERAPAPVEAAAYFVVAEMVGRSGGRNVKVSGELRDGRLCVEVAGVVDGDLTDLEDRIGALDGVLTVDHGTVRAEVPCAS